MPLPHPELPMSSNEFLQMEHRLGWKHEYVDGAARLTLQESAVVSFELVTVDVVEVERPASYRLRLIDDDDLGALIQLFEQAFDASPDFTGWPERIFRRHARDSIVSFFGGETKRRAGGAGYRAASFVITDKSQLIAAVLTRQESDGPTLAPIMVHPDHQRRGLATHLLHATLSALRDECVPMLRSHCYLANAASLAWHTHNGFIEIPNSVTARHRWEHYECLARHYAASGQAEREQHMLAQATEWQELAERLEVVERSAWGLRTQGLLESRDFPFVPQ